MLVIFLIAALSTLCSAANATTQTHIAISNYVHAQSKEHSFGHLSVRGFAEPFEIFRASFGGLFPCGSRDLVVSKDEMGCSYKDDNVLGKYVVTKRGVCSFIDKGLAAQRAGAAGVLVVNNEVGAFRMPMANASQGFELVIPLGMLKQNQSAPLLRYITKYGHVHGSMGPVRAECVDPVAEDAERRAIMKMENIPFTAALASRVGPSSFYRSKLEQEEHADTKLRSISDSPDDVSTNFQVLSDGTVTLSLNGTDKQEAIFPGSWPAQASGAVRIAFQSLRSASARLKELESSGNDEYHALLSFLKYNSTLEFNPLTSFEGYAAYFSGPLPLPDSEIELMLPLEYAPLPEKSDAHFTESNSSEEKQFSIYDTAGIDDSEHSAVYLCRPLADPESLLRGKWLIAARGICPMITKSRMAAFAGAEGLLIVNSGPTAPGQEKHPLGALEPLVMQENRCCASRWSHGVVALSQLPPECEGFSIEVCDESERPLGAQVAQAIGDGSEVDEPLEIPVVMISELAALALFKVVDDPSSLQMNEFLSQLLQSNRIFMSSSSSSSNLWNELEELRKDRNPFSQDPYLRQRRLLALLATHSPYAKSGDSARFEALIEVANAHGFLDDALRLASVVEQSLSNPRSATQSDLLGEDSITQNLIRLGQFDQLFFSELHSPVHPFLIRDLNHATLKRTSEGILRCRQESGNTYSIRVSDFDKKGHYSLSKKVQDLLQQQACLEKHIFNTAFTLGSYLQQLRSESNAREWRSITASLFSNVGVPETDSMERALAYIELSKALGPLVTGMNNQIDPKATIQSYLKGYQKQYNMDLDMQSEYEMNDIEKIRAEFTSSRENKKSLKV